MLRRWYDIERDLAVMDELRRRMENVFGETNRTTTQMTGSWPRANLYDAGNMLVAVLSVPGLTEENIQIEAHQDAITISGTRKLEKPEEYRVHRQERRSGRFSRTFGLPCQIDLEKTSASLKNGLLTLTMEKHAASQPRQIAIKAE